MKINASLSDVGSSIIHIVTVSIFKHVVFYTCVIKRGATNGADVMFPVYILASKQPIVYCITYE